MFNLMIFLIIINCIKNISSNFCAEHQFECKNGQCINETSVCDFYPDCSDWSDEDNCGWCNFDQSTGLNLCGWNMTGPLYHQCNIESWYHNYCGIYVQTDKYVSYGMTSPVLAKMSKHCKFQFFSIDYSFSGGICGTKNSVTVNGKDISQFSYGNLYTIDLGYTKSGSIVKISGFISFHCGAQYYDIEGYRLFTNFTFVNCNPTKIPIGCNFQSSYNCSWWFNGTRYGGKWTWNKEGFIYNNESKLAEIRSPLIEPNSPEGSCLSFNYLLNGTENVLDLSKINLGSDRKEFTLWKTTITTNGTWQMFSLFINTTIDIDIGFLSSSTNGIVAITNITYTMGYCDGIMRTTTTSDFHTKSTKTNGVTSPSPLISTTENTLGDEACTFETQYDRNYLCGFHFVVNSCANSKVVSRAHGFTGNGPDIDHTLSKKSGWFLNFQPIKCSITNGSDTVQVKFVSEKFYTKSPRCLFFWYQLSGDKVNSLSVSIVHNTDSAVHLWHTTTEVLTWKSSSVFIDVEGSFNLEFIASFKISSSNLGFVSIDDIVIESEDECL